MQDNMHDMDSEYNLNEIQLVVFKLASEFYAVDILKVKEIKLMTNITRVPHSPDYYKGVINLRGSVFPVIDLKKRLNLPDNEYTDETRIIMVRIEDTFVGIIVDSVVEVTTVDEKVIEPIQTGNSEVNNKYLSGVAKHNEELLILLNIEAIAEIE
ncbi:chemotaxis protein CheW [Succinispira mobilis]|uniref:chemotaxis protein CheW n=1 Tax=Succinispira mobilis TaxID=78120 RepID=UPI000362D7F9|nr:chemotaxis protein CheW [Succinispira mobilis]